MTALKHRPGPTGPTPERHRKQTEARLLLGGFALLLVVGGLLLRVLFGPTLALIGIGVVLGAGVLFVLLWGLLRALETWAKS